MFPDTRSRLRSSIHHSDTDADTERVPISELKAEQARVARRDLVLSQYKARLKTMTQEMDTLKAKVKEQERGLEEQKSLLKRAQTHDHSQTEQKCQDQTRAVSVVVDGFGFNIQSNERTSKETNSIDGFGCSDDQSEQTSKRQNTTQPRAHEKRTQLTRSVSPTKHANRSVPSQSTREDCPKRRNRIDTDGFGSDAASESDDKQLTEDGFGLTRSHERSCDRWDDC